MNVPNAIELNSLHSVIILVQMHFFTAKNTGIKTATKHSFSDIMLQYPHSISPFDGTSQQWNS